jgi:hypothetical protein
VSMTYLTAFLVVNRSRKTSDETGA